MAWHLVVGFYVALIERIFSVVICGGLKLSNDLRLLVLALCSYRA